MLAATKYPPSPRSALFVVNKWDLLVQQQSEEEQKDFLCKLANSIGTRWPGFRAEWQLITMNAKLASLAQELGATTADVQKLCNRISSILPAGIGNLLLRALRYLWTGSHSLADGWFDGLKMCGDGSEMENGQTDSKHILMQVPSLYAVFFFAADHLKFWIKLGAVLTTFFVNFVCQMTRE